MNPQSIFLEKRSRVLLSAPQGKCPREVVATFNSNIQSLGFTCSKELFEALSKAPQQAVLDLYQEVLPILKKMVGAHRNFSPMYPNFPQQVMEASDVELYCNAMLHYWGFALSDLIGKPELSILPSYAKDQRDPLDEVPKYKVIELGTTQEFRDIFKQIVLSNSSITPFDKEVLKWFLSEESKFVSQALKQIEKIPQKETLAFLVGSVADPAELKSFLKTATDVLRVAVVMSDGDVSLAEPCKFICFSKKQRRLFLSVVNEISPIEDMLRWKERWIRLGERLHPGDYKDRFPAAFHAFDVLRNNLPFETFNGRVEKAIKAGELTAAAELLAKRGGVFARRLDHLLRLAAGTPKVAKQIVDLFESVAETVSTPVLLQSYNHFKNREDATSRTFFPKGNVAKFHTETAQVSPIRDVDKRRLSKIIRSTLVERFAKLPSLGKVYLAESMKNYFVPFALRSASKTLKTLTRGSRVSLDKGECVRLFLWWKNMPGHDGRVDIDLSAMMMSEDWDGLGQIAYYNLRGQGVYHSGDITSAPNGACEFIDINMNSLNPKARYVAVTIHSFTSQPYCNLPECFAGWMMREKPQSGEVFEARTVQNKIDIASNTVGCIPFVVDLKTRQVIWTDLGMSGRNLYGTSDRVCLATQALAELNRPRLYDLFEMHIEARGKRVFSADKADVTISETGNLTPLDLDRVMSEFLA